MTRLEPKQAPMADDGTPLQRECRTGVGRRVPGTDLLQKMRDSARKRPVINGSRLA